MRAVWSRQTSNVGRKRPYGDLTAKNAIQTLWHPFLFFIYIFPHYLKKYIMMFCFRCHGRNDVEEKPLNQDSMTRNKQFLTAELWTNDCCKIISLTLMIFRNKEMEQFHAVFLKNKKDKSIWNYHCNVTLILPDVDVNVGLIV